LTVYPGERVGLIGPNGAGKSTLFKLILNQVKPDQGSVALATGTKIGHLAQDPVFDHENTVIDEAELAFAKLHELSHRLRDLEHEMGEVEGDALEKVLEKYQDVTHDFEMEGGYAWRHKLEAILHGVGLHEDSWEQKVSTLSGGQRSRLALAKLLVAEPDLLLLDEPTNHLDLTAVEWLENYLSEFKGAVILISHDRYLLDRIATRIVWLKQHKLKSYTGNYSSFVTQRDLEELSQQRAYEEQKADIEKQAEYIRRFKAGQRARQAKGRERRLDALLSSDRVLEEVTDTSKISLSIETDRRAGDQVLKVRELSKSFGERALWKDVKLEIKRGDRVGIIGPNGSGKTTLLKVLVGEEKCDTGVIKWGANLGLGYYNQRLDDFDPEASVMEEVWGDRDVKEQEVRNICGAMLFRGDDIYKPVGQLSGGERARVRLAQLLIEKPNVLLLDEPTNHLDIASCEALETTLQDFPGTILCVSHDRYFLDKVTKTLLVVTPPNVEEFEGNYSKWHAHEQAIAQNLADAKAAKPKGKGGVAQPTKPAVVEKSESGKKKDNPYARPFGKLTTRELEGQITETEIAVSDAQSRFGDPELRRNPGKAKSHQSEFDQLSKKLKQLEEEYFLRGE